MGQETSKPKQYKMTKHDKAILELKKSRDNIDKYSQSMFKKIGMERRQVKNIISKKSKNKDGKLSPTDEMKCKSILKRIRYQESLVNKAVQQLMSLEEMILSIDFKQVEMTFMEGLENGNTILKQLNQELSLEKVDDLLDESEEQMAIANEINEVLGEHQINVAGQQIEDEVDLELQDMIKEMEGSVEMRKPDSTVEKFPNVSHLPELEPKKEKLQKEETEEEEEGYKEQRVLIPS